MAFKHADRVKETTTTTGLGTYSLAGAVAGFRTFVAGVGTTNRCTYLVENGTDWEINEGTVTDAAPDTLTRDLLLASSTGAAINWGAGTKNIMAVYAAAHRNPRTRKLTADHSISSSTNTEVTGLKLTDVQPGTYVAQYFLILQSAGTTIGFRFSVNFTGTTVRQVIHQRYPSSGTTAATGVVDENAVALAGQLEEAGVVNLLGTTTNSLVTGGVSAINTDLFLVIEVIIEVSAAGNLELWHGSEGATATVVESGSSVILTRIDD